jgi:hypothetical protein
MKTPLFVASLLLAALLANVARSDDKPSGMKKTFVTAKGQLEGKLVYTMVQIGGFAGSLGNSVVIEPDGTWSGARVIAGRRTELKGKLTKDEIEALGAKLAEFDLAGLPRIIGSPTAKPPRVIADGASTTTKLLIGSHSVVSNSADGVESKEEEIALRTRLTMIGNAIQDATLNAATTE